MHKYAVDWLEACIECRTEEQAAKVAMWFGDAFDIGHVVWKAGPCVVGVQRLMVTYADEYSNSYWYLRGYPVLSYSEWSHLIYPSLTA